MTGFHKSEEKPPPRPFIGSRNFYLTLAAIASLVVGLVLVQFTDRIAQRRAVLTSERQEGEALTRKAREWAIHQALAEAARTDTVNPLRLSQLEAAAKQWLQVTQASSDNTPSGFFDFVADPDKIPARIGFTLLHGGSIALLIGSALFIIAIPLLSVAAAVGEDLAKRTVELKEEGGGETPIAWSFLMGSAGRAARGTLIPGVVASGAAVTIGVIAIAIAGRTIHIIPASSDGTADVQLSKLDLLVEPGTVRVTPQMLNSAPIDSQLPPLRFELPAVQVDDKSLRALVESLVAYRETLGEQQAYREAVLALTDRVRELERTNGELTATLEERPTKEAIERAQAELATRSKVETAVAEALSALAKQNESLAVNTKTLAEQTQGLVKTAERQTLGTTFDALQYARTLNAQNDHLFNQLFRPGVIKQNCETYRLLNDVFAPVPDQCIEKGAKDAFLFMPRKVRSWFTAEHRPAADSPATPTVAATGPTN